MMMTPMRSVSSARLATWGGPQSSPGIDEAGPIGPAVVMIATSIAPFPRDRARCCSDLGGLGDRSVLHLVEAGAAVDRSVVARSERHDRLASAMPADRGVELPWPADSAGTLGNGTTRRAALRVVQQTLAGE